MEKQLVYKGFVKEKNYGENCDALFIGDTDYPLAEILEESIDRKQVSVRYWVSDKEKTKEDLQKGFLETLYGIVTSEYGDRYSEVTGYLWTDENLMIGGHDLMSELRSCVDKFVYLEIDIENETL